MLIAQILMVVIFVNAVMVSTCGVVIASMSTSVKELLTTVRFSLTVTMIMEFIIALAGMDICHHLVTVSHAKTSMNVKWGHTGVPFSVLALIMMVPSFVNASMDTPNLPMMELIVRFTFDNHHSRVTHWSATLDF